MEGDWPDFRTLDWQDLYPRLLVYAAGRVRRLHWRGERLATPPGAALAANFVQIAIEKAMSAERRYDASKTILQNLCQIISSEVSNLTQSYENRNVGRADDDAKVTNIQDYRDSPETVAAHTQMVSDLLSYLEANDIEAKQVAEQIILYDITKTTEPSIELRIPVTDIENTKKRLRRLCARYMEESGARSSVASVVRKSSLEGSRNE